MLYFEDTRIEAMDIHVVGNKAKDEPLMASPALSAQVTDEALMQTLTGYFLDGFKSEECYNLYHETDLACNEVWNFVGKIFDDPASLHEHSVSLARHLYECGTLPQIKGGEFYVVYFSACRLGGETVDAVGLFKSETRDTFLDARAGEEGVHLTTCQGIDIKRLDKGAVVFNLERDAGFVVRIVDNTNRTEARYWADDFLRVRPRRDSYHNTHNALAMCRKYVTRQLAREFDVSRPTRPNCSTTRCPTSRRRPTSRSRISRRRSSGNPRSSRVSPASSRSTNRSATSASRRSSTSRTRP